MRPVKPTSPASELTSQLAKPTTVDVGRAQPQNRRLEWALMEVELMNVVTAFETLRATQRSKRERRGRGPEWIGYIVIDGWGVSIAIVFRVSAETTVKGGDLVSPSSFSFSFEIFLIPFSFVSSFFRSFFSYIYFLLFVFSTMRSTSLARGLEKLMTGRLGRILYTQHCGGARDSLCLLLLDAASCLPLAAAPKSISLF